ncbi:hypothetical protein [Clostridium sp. DL-VIII]|uniref:GNAT family N-acetyltransferase n=1 Tax=Clostridium sp. DL-VIII TaxID=641107 RepID=UPI0002EFCB49|nr:hypothetical protein [Clostridium sp. DL-VIII]
MLIKFSGQDNILDSKPFIDDEVQFNLLHLIRESKSPLLYMNENKVPVLYTDLSNPASNKAYKNVGFIECGKVTQVVFEGK